MPDIHRSANDTVSASKYAPITKADSDLPGGTTRGLLVGTAGTANLMEFDGSSGWR